MQCRLSAARHHLAHSAVMSYAACRNGVFCPATRGGGRGRKRAGAASGQTPPEEDAAAARADAADAAKDAVEDAGDQLADAIGAGVNRAEGTVASTQAQGAVSSSPLRSSGQHAAHSIAHVIVFTSACV